MTTNKEYGERYKRYLGNRMMLELVLGRRLTQPEQRKLYGKSSLRLERQLWRKTQ